jgi:hypothetical protein
VVAQAAGLELFEVEYADRDGNSLSGRDRYRSLQIAQVFLKGSAQAALLFDEVEDVFPPISSEAAQLMARAEQVAAPPAAASAARPGSTRSWNPTRCPPSGSPTASSRSTRRFAAALPTTWNSNHRRPARAKAWCARRWTGVAVSDAFVAKLTGAQGPDARADPHGGALCRAGPGGRNGDDGGIDRAPAAQRRPGAGQQAQGAGERRSVTTYDLDMLNVETRFEIPRIVQALQARGHGTLCFYGAPGTGKTALAEHIAKALDRPLIIKQASDLMSKFVGETEQNMAAMFREAEAEKAVLLLDEADSFLQDRRGAQRTYEVTEVNEMLQGMERFNGIFVCTTNLLDRIDQAALRRFTFKIKFMPLTAAARNHVCDRGAGRRCRR